MIGAPLFAGALQLASNRPSPGVNVGADGLDGTDADDIGVPRAVRDHGPWPTEFRART